MLRLAPFGQVMVILLVGALFDHLFDWSNATCIIYLSGAALFYLAKIANILVKGEK